MNRLHSRKCGNNLAGYTLVELAVVVLIVGIVAATAVASYRGHVVESCRGEAKIALENVANAQEKFYFDANQFASSISSLPVAALSSEGYYAITTGLNGNSNTFIATAVQAPGQTCLPANDIRYRITNTGLRQRNETGSWVNGWN